MLNDEQESQLQMAYIKEFKKLCPFVEKMDKSWSKTYNTNWDITESQSIRELEEIDYDNDPLE